MRLFKRLILLLFLINCSLTSSAENSKKILILNSYHNGLSWTDSTLTSIKRELSKDPSNMLFIEYMDTKRYFSEDYLNLLNTYYSQKYKNEKFDLIISTDNNAYDFLLKYRDEIFGKVPVLFSGLNSIINPPKSYSGVFENFSVCGTLNLIETNHPNYSEIVVVCDHSTTGDALASALTKEVNKFAKPIRYRIIRPDSMQDLQIQLSRLDENDMVLYLVYNRDINGNYYTYERGFNLAHTYCNVPVYCVWDFYLNRGAIGGSLITGRVHGKQVANMARLVLSGTPIDSIPPCKAKYEYIFDSKQLTKFGIKRKNLPKGSHFINEPYSFVKENKEIVALTLTIVILLTVIIIVLTINMQLRKVRAQKDLNHLLETKATNKKLEKAIEEAEESSRLKSAFLANMSHEIRTPMNAILGFTELLSGDNVTDAKRKKFISIIQKNTNGLLHLISDILDISKIETNQLKIIPNKCKLEDILNSVKESYDAIIKQNENQNIQFKIKVPEKQIIDEVWTDGIRLQQVFTNLIENSIKFTNAGEIEIGYQVKDLFIRFFVHDTGIGIPEDKQEIIFDRFRQAEMDANTRQYGGAGLGLAISKSLIEMLGGTMWMKSKPHVGTSFFFTIPIKK